MTITPIEHKVCQVDLKMTMNPKLKVVPNWMIDLSFRNGAFLFIEALRQAESILDREVYRDRYLDPDDAFYMRLRKRIREELPSEALHLPPCYERKVTRDTICIGMKIRKGRDWRTRCVYKESEKDRVEKPFRAGDITQEIQSNDQVSSGSGERGDRQKTMLFGVIESVTPEDSVKRDGSLGSALVGDTDTYYAGEGLSDEFAFSSVVGVVAGINVPELTCSVAWSCPGYMFGEYRSVFKGYRIGKNNKFDLSIFFESGKEDDNVAREMN